MMGAIVLMPQEMSEKPLRQSRSGRQASPGSAIDLTVEELSSRTGVSVRNIRAYQTAGLMPPPRLLGRTAHYNSAHVGKLELIRDLRKQGFKLEAIKAMLTGTPQGAWTEYAIVSQLFSTTFFTVEQPQRKAISAMASHWAQGASQAQKDRLSENGLYRRIGPDEVEMLSPSLERIGIQLAELDVPLDTVLDLQDELIHHSRAIARAYVEQLFIGMVDTVTKVHSQRAALDDKSPGEAGELGEGKAQAIRTVGQDPHLSGLIKSLFERLRPLAIGSVSAAFPVVLQQEFERAIQQRLNQAKKAPGPSQGKKGP
jgi:DNA-binding transcriptional MerR regulator